MKNTKRKVVFGTFMAVVLAVIVSAACVSPALASTTYVLHFNAAVWSGVIEVPGQPKIGLVCLHYDRGYIGCGDMITVNLWIGPPYLWMQIALYTDNPSQYAFSKQLAPPDAAIYLVKPWQIHVCRIGKTVVASWTIPLVTPAVTIPPGCLVLKGYGDVFPSTLGPLPAGSGWTLTFEAQNYLAHETLICPRWHYCGPVGTGAEAALTGPPNISVEGTQTFYYP